ncbi:MAG: hypothetical protein LBH80_00965 [Prevotellaceae bacterium]|jgi:hypothetical protein|nr:hypothetical protein [Prevotellaceae bacterium]
MRHKIKYIFTAAWDLVFSTKQTWSHVEKEMKSVREIRSGYVFPWIAVCVLTSFVSSFFVSDTNLFEKAFLNFIITSAALVGGYFLTIKICRRYFAKEYPLDENIVKIETVVAYSFTTIFLLEVITSVFPSLFFLQILSIHAAYLVWEGSGVVFGIEEDKKGNIALVFALAIIFVPVLINRAIHWMLPNV